MDETLARPVSVLTFASGFPRIAQVVTAARAASRLTDPRIAQVFDVEDGGGQAYVVLEWVGGETLTDMLADGPLDPGRACSLVSEAARALAGAHAAGQAHLRLTPDALRWTRSSGVKITGLGIDAALAGDGLTGADGHDPAIADTVALAALLYAALTGYWPGEQQTGLPAAPVSDGVVCTPRQVSADVSSAIDSVICRALLQRTTRQGPPIQSPAEFADALAGVAPPVPLPEPAPPAPAGYTERGYPDHGGYGGYPANPNDPDTWQSPAARRAPPPTRSAGSPRSPVGRARLPAGPVPGGPAPGIEPRAAHRGRRARARRHRGDRVGGRPAQVGHDSASGGTGATASPRTSAVAPRRGRRRPCSSRSATARSTSSGARQQRGPELAHERHRRQQHDRLGHPYYNGTPKFGGLKPGTGLLIDMGKQVKLSQVEVLFGPGVHHGRDLPRQLERPRDVDTALSHFKLVGRPGDGHRQATTFTSARTRTGRYVLIWLTSLPPMVNPPAAAVPGQGQQIYQGLIYDVAVRGTPASAAG